MPDPAPVSRLNVSAQVLVFLLRVAVGWHFLYEGVFKFAKWRESERFAELAKSLGAEAKWTGYSVSKGYLAEATGPFAETFHAWAANPATLRLLDELVLAGLILCGACLMVGLLTRLACAGAIGMLAMFYISAPPWGVQQIHSIRDELIERPIVIQDGKPTPVVVKDGKLLPGGDVQNGKIPVLLPDGRTVAGKPAEGGVRVVYDDYDQVYLTAQPAFATPGAKPARAGPTEGNYLLVNKNLIELIAVALLLALNAGFVCGLDLLVRRCVTARWFGAGAAPSGAASRDDAGSPLRPGGPSA